MQNSDMQTLEQLYPINAQFYCKPPPHEVSLETIKETAVDRLKMFRIIERANNKRLRVYSKEWKEAIIVEMSTEPGLRGYTRLLSLADSKKRSVFEARKADFISHFILRLVYCENEDMERWFLSRELELFRLKFMDHTSADIKSFLKFHNLNYTPITLNEKNDLREKLNDSTAGHDAMKIDMIDFYRVPFIEVPDLVRHRRCLIWKGFAYVSAQDFISVLCTKLHKIIEEGLQMAKFIRANLLEDDRFQDIIKYLHTSYTGKDFSVAKDAAVAIENLDKLSKKSFPLCMRYTHETVRAKHHLKHGARMQYGLFLKGIGVTLEDSLRFWREEFTKTMDLEKFEKSYSYNIRHNYGKAGGMKDYAPYSCQKIINTVTGAADTCGCPYKNFDTTTLRTRLVSYGLSAMHLQEVLNFSSKGHFQLACGKYFEILHDTKLDMGIDHPNRFFELSQMLINKKAKTVTPSRTANLKRPHPPGRTSSQYHGASQSQSQMTQASTQNDLLDTQMTFDEDEVEALEKSYC